MNGKKKLAMVGREIGLIFRDYFTKYYGSCLRTNTLKIIQFCSIKFELSVPYDLIKTEIWFIEKFRTNIKICKFKIFRLHFEFFIKFLFLFKELILVAKSCN